MGLYVPVVPRGVINETDTANHLHIILLFWSVRLASEAPALSALFHEERARVAVLARYHAPDYPALVAARRRLRDVVLVDAVTRALTKAGPLTPDLKDRIAALLDAAEVAA